MGLASLLLLADGRLPAGGHAHSGGLEEAVASGRVSGVAELDSYLRGRLATVGRVDAALAVAAWRRAPRAMEVDGEAAARCPSPALRRASRAQGRGLLRAGRRMWPSPELEAMAAARADGPMWPVALGAVGAAAGLGAVEVALVAAHASVSGPASAATRLLGLDPLAVAGCLASLVPALDAEAENAAAIAGPGAPLAGLPADSGPLVEIGAEAHEAWEVRLFAS